MTIETERIDRLLANYNPQCPLVSLGACRSRHLVIERAVYLLLTTPRSLVDRERRIVHYRDSFVYFPACAGTHHAMSS
jgi:hypothetical protein